jgi:monoamine oxidase
MSLKIIQCKTVIIGAGMAGIGASLNFFNNKYNDFMVFEALERIGGRVFTDANGNIKLIYKLFDNKLFFLNLFK